MVFSEKGGGNSVNEGFGKDFYRKGNSVKRSGPFSEPPDAETEKLLSSSPSENQFLSRDKECLRTTRGAGQGKEEGPGLSSLFREGESERERERERECVCVCVWEGFQRKSLSGTGLAHRNRSDYRDFCDCDAHRGPQKSLAISETRLSNVALRFKGAMGSR